MIENPKWKRCSFLVPSVEGYEDSFYGTSILNDALGGKLGGIVSKEGMVNILEGSYTFIEVQGLYLSNAPEGYSCYVYKQPTGSFRWISLPSNFSIESAEAIVESVYENDYEGDYKNLFGVQKQMKKAKSHALLKLDAIVSYDKVMNIKPKFNPRLAMAMKRMGKVLEKEKGFDFHFVETEKNLEVFATGEEISPTKILVFRRTYTAQFSFDYLNSKKLEINNQALEQIRDYFGILATTEAHINFAGKTVAGFPFRYEKDTNIDELYKMGFWTASYHIGFIMKCFEMFTKEKPSSIYDIPQYVQTMLNKRKGKSYKEGEKNEFAISNAHIPFTTVKPGWRERGNRGNPSSIWIVKGTKIVANWKVKVNRAGNKLIESLPMLYFKSGEEDKKLLEIQKDISEFLQEGAKQLKQEYADDYFGNIAASLIAYLNKKYIEVNIPLIGNDNVYAKSIHRWTNVPTYAYFLHGDKKTWEKEDFVGLETTQESTHFDKMVFYDKGGYWYQQGEKEAHAKLINCYNGEWDYGDDTFLDATYDAKGNLTGFTLEEPSFADNDED